MNRCLRRARLTAFAVLNLAGLALAVTAGSMTARPALADDGPGVKVYVGYADDVRADATRFPTPWAGDAGVVFDGCQPRSTCAYDAGAAMVVNDTSSPVTVNSVVIHFSTCTYDIWGHDVVLAAGGELVVTQRTSGAGNGCEPATGRMDSSDIGPNGVGWAGNCSPSGVTPEVDVTVDGSVSTLFDYPKVLNTGGIDSADCGGGNESTQWSLIGTICPTSQLVLEPATQTEPAGATATVDATFTNSCSQPLPGTTVDFVVLSGPNAGRTGSGVTDAQGVATFSYTGNALGLDTLEASITNTVGVITSNTATVDWVNRPPDCSAASATPGTLWPPDHRMLAVTIAGVTDPDGDAVTTTVTGVAQDEPLDGLGDGDTSPDANLGAASDTALVRAERSGLGDGRVYVISFTSSDGNGGSCSGSVDVTVPHDQGQGATAVDSGQRFDSLGR